MNNGKQVEENRFIVSVKVGPKGQITIPKEARKMFNINEGDVLMILGDSKKGLAIAKADDVYKLFEGKNIL